MQHAMLPVHWITWLCRYMCILYRACCSACGVTPTRPKCSCSPGTVGPRFTDSLTCEPPVNQDLSFRNGLFRVDSDNFLPSEYRTPRYSGITHDSHKSEDCMRDPWIVAQSPDPRFVQWNPRMVQIWALRITCMALQGLHYNIPYMQKMHWYM